MCPVPRQPRADHSGVEQDHADLHAVDGPSPAAFPHCQAEHRIQRRSAIQRAGGHDGRHVCLGQQGQAGGGGVDKRRHPPGHDPGDRIGGPCERQREREHRACAQVRHLLGADEVRRRTQRPTHQRLPRAGISGIAVGQHRHAIGAQPPARQPAQQTHANMHPAVVDGAAAQSLAHRPRQCGKVTGQGQGHRPDSGELARRVRMADQRRQSVDQVLLVNRLHACTTGIGQQDEGQPGQRQE